ncbi:MAG: Holliday junction resolvase RecU [Defluviitaleaceae bacterium]|nr:Holliday junction resolvase RecU [Defluviitaleaceae bacterium]
MAQWNTRGLRGSAFEEMINLTNQLYWQHGLAIIQKVPTPITPIEVSNKDRIITKAFFGEKSTVDYIGVVQGIAICFDAKETQSTNIPLRNIHEHQMAFMETFMQQDGVAFLLIHFTAISEIFFLPWEQIKHCYDMAQQGGRKSIPYSDFDPAYRLRNAEGFPVHYLEGLSTYLTKK